MSYDDKMSAFAELNAKREKARAEAELRVKETEVRIPEIADINRRLAAVGPRLMQLGIEGGDDFEEKANALHEEHEALICRKHALLEEHGYPRDYDLPVYSCKLCNDSGYVDSRLCSCVREAIVKRAYYSSGLGKALEGQTFETIDMRYYTGNTESGASVKEQMRYVVGHCKAFATEFSPGKESLLMIGGSGRGKTHFASAIGREVIKKGYSVVYESASNIVNNFEAERFGRAYSNDNQRYFECDLLIIDDLGTEFNTQFTLSVLFNLFNSRIINGVSTVVTTNLSLKEIESLYKERIFSRLSGDFTVLPFCGKDIRRQRKGTQ